MMRRAGHAPSRCRIPGLLAGLAAVLLLSPAPAHQASAASVRPAAPQPAAADTVVVVVSADSPLVELRRQWLADIYLGRSSRFPDGRRAVPIDLEPGIPERAEFYERYLGRSLAEVKTHWSKLIFTGRGRPPPALSSGEEVKGRVSGDPSAIGYLEEALVDGSVRVVRIR